MNLDILTLTSSGFVTGTANVQTFGNVRVPRGTLIAVTGSVMFRTNAAGVAQGWACLTKVSQPFDYTVLPVPACIASWAGYGFQAATQATDGATVNNFFLPVNVPLDKNQSLYIHGLVETTMDVEIFLNLHIRPR